MIDPHVHCRDGNQSYKETVEHALDVAEKAGLTAIFDMPNTDPPITTRELVRKRLSLADKVDSYVSYGLYMGLTSNKEQIKEAVETHKEFFPRVVGFKLFAGHSVGNLGIIDVREQRFIYETLTRLNYKGVLAVHCEKESLLRPLLWDPKNPISHTEARPKEAEIESVKDQIQFSFDAGFEGKLHITHVSVPETVELIDEYRDELNISCGVTPHHCILHKEMMNQEKGLLYKMNPPLRDKNDADGLLGYLKSEKIDYVESDHAPHTLEEKANPPYMSGIPNIPFTPIFINILREKGFSEEIIRRITFDNIVKIFEIFRLNLQPSNVKPRLDLSSEYEFDPYESISVI